MASSDSNAHHSESESYASLRTKALESLLVEKGFLSTDSIDAMVRAYEQDIGPMNGAQVVARAWTDASYKQRLLEKGAEAIEELGFGGAEGSEIVVLENTPNIHNMVVCTLCSCYPWPVLGLPPTWYKSAAYRSRAVIEPRAVLREFGLDLPESVEIRVWDSSADVRYMVLPERPEGTDSMSEAQLLEIVTRDSMIGVAKLKSPTEAG
jgi:nitrile hydratase